MANAILNFHFDYLHTSLKCIPKNHKKLAVRWGGEESTLMVSLIVKYPFFYEIPKYIRDSSILEEELQKGPNFKHDLLFKKN